MAGSDNEVVSYPFSWWSPDERLDLPTSSSLDQGNEDFLNVCQILSLAPEWYKDGLVSIEYQPPDVPQVEKIVDSKKPIEKCCGQRN